MYEIRKFHENKVINLENKMDEIYFIGNLCHKSI